MKEYIDRQVEIRNRAWEEAKSILDKATAEKRDLSAEENQTYERIAKELDERGQAQDPARNHRDDRAHVELRVEPVHAR